MVWCIVWLNNYLLDRFYLTKRYAGEVILGFDWLKKISFRNHLPSDLLDKLVDAGCHVLLAQNDDNDIVPDASPPFHSPKRS